MSKKGFTLIELMIVVAIIGVLALIAVDKFDAIRGEKACKERSSSKRCRAYRKSKKKKNVQAEARSEAAAQRSEDERKSDALLRAERVANFEWSGHEGGGLYRWVDEEYKVICYGRFDRTAGLTCVPKQD